MLAESILPTVVKLKMRAFVKDAAYIYIYMKNTIIIKVRKF